MSRIRITAASQTDPSLANFSISHDNAYILPILQQALQLNPAATVMATLWSPPGWMKSSDSMIGGSLNAADYQVFANYLVKFLQAYKNAGVPVSLITPQNEPEYSPSNYPGATLTASQEAGFIANDLGPAIQNAGLNTKILGYDHNWNDTSFPETILGDSAAAQYTAGTAWHCYSGDPSAQTTVHNAYPSKDTYFTECSGSQSANPASTFSDSLDWQTENLIIGATRNWAKSVVTWNMALDWGGPSMNCTTCTGVVTVDNSAGTATYNAEYYVLGQASKFVKPGAVRIDSNTFGSGNIEDVAFANPDGSDALIVLNADTANAHTFNVDENGQSFTYTLPAKAVATFTWTPGSGEAPTPPTAAPATAPPSSSGPAIAATPIRNGSSSPPAAATTRSSPATLPRWDGTLPAVPAPQVTESRSSSYSFTPRNNTSECLDVTNASTADGAGLQQWSCTGGSNRSFTLNAVN